MKIARAVIAKELSRISALLEETQPLEEMYLDWTKDKFDGYFTDTYWAPINDLFKYLQSSGAKVNHKIQKDKQIYINGVNKGIGTEWDVTATRDEETLKFTIQAVFPEQGKPKYSLITFLA